MSVSLAVHADNMPVVTPFNAALGAEVSGVDLARPLSDAQFAVIEAAAVTHLVLVSRRQPLTVEQHITEFARQAIGPRVSLRRLIDPLQRIDRDVDDVGRRCVAAVGDSELEGERFGDAERRCGERRSRGRGAGETRCPQAGAPA